MKSVEEQFEDHIKYIEACKKSLIPGYNGDWTEDSDSSNSN